MALESLFSGDVQAALSNPWFLTLIIVAALWKFAWYGAALWKTIEKKRNIHFIVMVPLMMVVNDLGILAIGYLIWDKYYSSKKKT